MAEKHLLLGELRIKAGLIDLKILDRALKLQADDRRRLGYLLVRMEHITEDDLQATPAWQLGLTLISAENLFTDEAKTVLPRSICNHYRFFASNLPIITYLNWPR